MVPGTWQVLRQWSCCGLITSVAVWLWLLDIKGLGRIFVIWPPYLGWTIGKIRITSFSQAESRMTSQCESFPLSMISAVAALLGWQPLVLTVREGRETVWRVPLIFFTIQYLHLYAFGKHLCSLLIPILMIRRLRVATLVKFAALIPLCAGSGLSVCFDCDIKNSRICLGDQDSMVLGSWKQLTHLNGLIFFLDHCQKINIRLCPSASAHLPPLRKWKGRSMILTRSK